MRHPFCPNPTVLQRLRTGPLGASLDTLVQPLLDQGYASAAAKDMMRRLADLSSGRQRQPLPVMDLNEPRVDAFLHDRYGRYHPTRSDRAILR